MATNLAIDDDLLLEAQKIGQQPTKKSTVTKALEEYIARRKRLKALDMFGKLELDPNYDYKKDRIRS
jgi:Arc/MetJ family transcription regulator